ncbi:MAG: hypothetical protein FJ125_17970, partial [Deltaproteobacteria bacterium]|nr:hypothetical protein [Deltaproteobacteria bacterium]
MKTMIPISLPLLLFTVLVAQGCVPDDVHIELTEAQRAKVAQELLPAPPRPKLPLDAVFGKKLELLGLDLEPTTLEPGGPFTLTWYWRSLQETDTDYMVFVHLDSDQGRKRMNLDHHPVRGLHPILHWKKGQIIRDVQKDRLDEDFPVGPATLWV